MKNLVVSLDLEMNQPSGKIIQIGAVMGDVKTGSIVDRFSAFVNPGESLSQEIITLTAIHQEDVDRASSLPVAYKALREWLEPHQKSRSLNPITWGYGDTLDLMSEMGLNYESEEWVFGRRWLDAKTVFTAWSMSKGKDARSGLSKSMGAAGIAFEGRAHNALVDAENTFRMWKFLVDEFN